ncbi:uncharacterized protein EI97DRAFT_398768 [Westerdykella ornata]|uniref:Luciferase domain-containing protein n=1 Tax=Westerdykella ornata TaxID=318751 RepID=A0A6A6JMF1_WESOR|nr:uncharacterized protein EI97DRAFT_398768 [Westerdykella ornata]KAF2276109.1 hypothetical protein EI97DRAFT_398768 [Westerdykella ornata]
MDNITTPPKSPLITNITSPPTSTLLPYISLNTPSTLLLNLSTLLAALLTIYYIHNDYLLFLSLGPGGTPSTPLGYLKIKLLSLISLRDPLRPLPIPPHFRPQKGYLTPTSLPKRHGPRPVIRGIAPQRQKTDISPPHIYQAFVHELQLLAADPENLLVERTSCFEKHSSGLFSTAPITRTCGGEVCHVHPSDGSLHLTLHPADARILIEAGRGERHPLAKGGWFRRFVPKEFVLVYAPRDAEEVRVVREVVAASVWWVSGLDVLGHGRGDRMVARGWDGEEVRGERERWCACRMGSFAKGEGEKMMGRA